MKGTEKLICRFSTCTCRRFLTEVTDIRCLVLEIFLQSNIECSQSIKPYLSPDPVISWCIIKSVKFEQNLSKLSTTTGTQLLPAFPMESISLWSTWSHSSTWKPEVKLPASPESRYSFLSACTLSNLSIFREDARILFQTVRML